MSNEDKMPYHYLLPIEDPRDFFGRKADLTFIRESIASKRCISFVGQPSGGLSSLLNRVMAEDFVEDCQSFGGPLSFVKLECSQFDDPLPLIQLLLRHLTPDHRLRKFPNWRSAFGSLVRATSALKEERLVILFDDFEKIGLNQRFVDFVDALRGLTTREDMSLITTSHTQLHKACHVELARSPFPNIFVVRYLGPFAELEVGEFLKVTSERSGVDLLPYSGQILDMAGRVPYYMQVACSHYYRAIAQNGQADHELVAEAFYEQIRPNLDRIWQELDVEERKALGHLVRSGSFDDSSSSLVRNGYISENGRFFSAAFSKYVHEMV